MPKEIKIGDKILGAGHPVFISAEVGTTCNGQVDTAKKLIEQAKEAGMDAVKFQILNPDKKISDHNMPYAYTRANGEKVTEKLHSMLKNYLFSFAQWQEIKNYAVQKGIICFCTVDHLEAVDLSEKLAMPAYKISSWDLTFLPLIRKAAQTQKPIILDLGPATLKEFISALEACYEQGNSQVIALHCFHTKNFAEMNLKTIGFLRESFDVLTGFSAPDEKNIIDYMALAFEPVMIEKRLTLNRQDPWHHHARALEPEEMKKYVKAVRALSQAVGKNGLFPSKKDLAEGQKHCRCLVAVCPIKKGETFTEKNLTAKRPRRDGIDAFYYDLVLGRKASKDFQENEPITWQNL